MRAPEHHLPVLGGGAGPAAVRAAGIPAQVQQQRRLPEPLHLPGVSGGEHLPQEPILTCGGGLQRYHRAGAREVRRGERE